jgi:hypothetical protein
MKLSALHHLEEVYSMSIRHCWNAIHFGATLHFNKLADSAPIEAVSANITSLAAI